MSLVYLTLLIFSVVGIGTTVYSTIAIINVSTTLLKDKDKKDIDKADVDELEANRVRHLVLAVVGFLMFLFSTGPLMSTTTFIIKAQTIGVEVRSTLDDFTPEEVAKVVRAVQEFYVKEQEK